MREIILDTLSDGRWLAWRHDPAADAIQFAWVPRDVRDATTFLSDLRPAADELRSFPRAAVADVAVSEVPLHFIVHAGLGGSTLLARALEQPGVVTTLKEPPILTDLIA